MSLLHYFTAMKICHLSLVLGRGLLQLANSNFADAYEHFKKLTQLDSSNVVVSVHSCFMPLFINILVVNIRASVY